jgi:D-glycero-D-manno-heptose 1,7-bisphosphate phosphatase
MRLRPAVILDRDGVINYDSDEYVKSWAEFHFQPGALEALRRLREARCEVYIATNQAGIGKGIYEPRYLRDIFLRMQLAIHQAGGEIHGIASCLHLRAEGCPCRKPAPGMLLKLAAKFGLDLSRSVFVGDSCTDIEAGQAVGCRTIFVRTRSPERIETHLSRCLTPPDNQAADLREAVQIILSKPE